jgi:hypothetical protein
MTCMVVAISNKVIKQESICLDPEPKATCPLCKDMRLDSKEYESWELFEHLKSNKHSKSNLASFFAYEAVSQGFWTDQV